MHVFLSSALKSARITSVDQSGMAIKKMSSELFICDKLLILFDHIVVTLRLMANVFFSSIPHLIIVTLYQLSLPRYTQQLVISSQVLRGEKSECFLCLIRIRGDVNERIDSSMIHSSGWDC